MGCSTPPKKKPAISVIASASIARKAIPNLESHSARFARSALTSTKRESAISFWMNTQ